MVIRRVLQKIIRPDETKNTTKFILVDAVGPEAAAAGIKVGDIVVPTAIISLILDGGASFRPMVEERNVAAVITDAGLDEFAIQNDSGSEFVSIDHQDAAQSFGVQDSTKLQVA